jgi:two-component system, LytTR family, response regulator AlgR
MSQMPLRVVIVDDEPLARSRLKMLVAEIERPRCAVVAECEDAATLHAALKQGHADCVLLDIQMPDVNGLEVAAQLRTQAEHCPAIIFVTAHDQHALRAFELEAADYLTKPVRRERLQAALDRVLRQRQVTTPEGEQATLIASEKGRAVRIAVADLLFLRAEAKTVHAVTAARTYILDESLTELEDRLADSERFVRVHRAVVVARESVAAFEKRAIAAASDAPSEAADTWAVHVAAVDTWLPVSRRQLPTVKEALMA